MKYGSVAFCSLGAPLLALLFSRPPQLAGGDPLQNAATVVATFVDRDGNSVHDVSIDRTDEADTVSVAKVESDGRVEFAIRWNARSPHLNYWGNARRRGYQAHTFSFKLLADQNVDLGRITLEPGGVVRGRVVDEAGHGLGSAKVCLVAPHKPGASMMYPDQLILDSRSILDRGVTSDDGSFEIVGARVGSMSVAAKHESSYWSIGDAFQVDAEATVEVPLITLREMPEANRIEGIVLRPDGQPEVGAEVMSVRPGGHHSPPQERRAKTDGSGRFTVYWGHLPGGTLRLKVYPQNLDFADAYLPNVAVGARNVSVQLVPARHLLLHVVDNQGKPVEAYGWRLTPRAPGAARMTVEKKAPRENGYATVRAPTEPFGIKVNSSGHWFHMTLDFELGALPEVVEIELKVRTLK